MRLIFLISLIITSFALIWLQLYNLQIIQSPLLISNSNKQRVKDTLILRGDIRDRNSNLLVLDIVSYDIYNNIKDINKLPKDKISQLSTILNLSEEVLEKKLKQKINTRIASKVDHLTVKKIKDFDINFVYERPTVTRQYPHKHLAAHLLGFVNNDHIGQHGVEYYYNDLLMRPTEKDPTEPFTKGASIVLTIDSILQEYAEEILEETIKKTKAERGTVLTLSPKTGDIYAWATYPTYDPNQFYKEKHTKNWAITDVYEPGSTFKAITISTALENNIIDKNIIFYDDGMLKVGSRIIRNHEKTKPRQVDLAGLFQHSSNVAAAQVGLKMEPKLFYDSIYNFMFGQMTSIDLPGESDGLLLDHKKWREVDKATTAIGQGAISVTPIQLASAISAISNHGIWTQPHVLKGIWDQKYMLLNESTFETNKVQVVSKETADFVSELLKQNVEQNLKAMAYIAGDVPGYTVAGKTGTAQKINPNGKGYMPGHTIASFVGYFPAEDPEILMLVVIDDPKTDGRWGNTIAGPVFNKVAKMAAKRILENT